MTNTSQTKRRGPLLTIALATMMLLGLAAQASAEVLYANWNQGDCHRTDTTAFSLGRRAEINKIVVLARWRAYQNQIGYTIYRGDRQVFRGQFDRAECRPHRPRECRGVDNVRLRLPAGTYRLVLDRNRLCANGASGGRGMIRVRGAWAPPPPPPPARTTVLFSLPRAVCRQMPQSNFRLTQNARVTQIAAWLLWPSGVKRVRYSIVHKGLVVHRGILVKAPGPRYFGRGAPGIEKGLNLGLRRGHYRLVFRNAHPCGSSHSGNMGFVRVYGNQR